MNTSDIHIPFLDLAKINTKYQSDFDQVFKELTTSGRYIQGKLLERFEHAFASFCGAKHCIGTGNGLDALTLILKGYIAQGKLQKGDEVLVPAHTFIATILSVKLAGLKPIFIEPDENTFNSSITEISKHISTNTKAIIVTHLYGQLVDIDPIKAEIKDQNMLCVADAAQAHGAINKEGKVAGDIYDAAAFSFYPAKNLGALGDGGAVTTNDKELARHIRMLGNYGASEKYVHQLSGMNSRLDEFQAGILYHKLQHLDEDNNKRRAIAKRYLSEITNPNIQLPFWDGTKNHVFHLFVVRVKNRDQFCSYLDTKGVGYVIHYPIPPHKQQALSEFSALSLPITEKLSKEVVSIPLHPELSAEDITYIIETLNQF